VSLELHIFGPSTGESILLKLPGGGWGVIDAYRLGQTCPPLDFLAREGVDSLDFVCWTHPDDDHSSGMLDILQAYTGRIDRLWLFDGVAMKQIFALKSVQDSKYAGRRYWKPLYDEVDKLKAQLGANFEFASTNTKLYSKDEVDIVALAPAGEAKQQYHDRLVRAFSGADYPRSKTRQGDNDISVALQVKYCDSELLLGGDVPSEGWAWAIARLHNKPGPCCVVKASHHGSQHSYHLPLWQLIEAPPPGPTEIVITPFASKSLPSHAEVGMLRNHGNAVVTGSAGSGTGLSGPAWSAVKAMSKAAPAPSVTGSTSAHYVLRINKQGGIDSRAWL
jgi:hypothetical protein